MLDLAVGVLCIAYEDDAILGYADLLSRSSSDLHVRQLCHKSFGTRVFQLESQLFDSIAGVGRRDSSAGPVCSPSHDGRINRVRSEKGEDISLLPIPEGLQTFAEVDSGITCLRKRV